MLSSITNIDRNKLTLLLIIDCIGFISQNGITQLVPSHVLEKAKKEIPSNLISLLNIRHFDKDLQFSASWAKKNYWQDFKEWVRVKVN